MTHRFMRSSSERTTAQYVSTGPKVTQRL